MARDPLTTARRNAGVGTVSTFYSFKGGVGRTFALANVAWLLARWGRRVLCVDWDLEAPGLHRYLAPSAPPRDGVLELLTSSARGRPPSWEGAVESVIGPWSGGGSLELIGAGRRDERYFDRLQKVDWAGLFDDGLSPAVERLRAAWVDRYDHVLLDARTGVTDIGGISAAQLPDLLIMMLTATHQSVEGTLEVAARAESARRALPIDRGGFLCVPVPARIHSGEESLLEEEWLNRFEQRLAPLFARWKDRDVEVRPYLQQLRVREYARWSFGEHLPVREERLDDPLLVSWPLANLAALIDQRLVSSAGLVRNRQLYVGRSAATSGMAPPPSEARKGVDVFISYPHADRSGATELNQHLKAQGVRTFLDAEDIAGGENVGEALYRAREGSKMIAVLLSENSQDAEGQKEELAHVVRLGEEKDTMIVPIFLDRAGMKAAPRALQNRFGISYERGSGWKTVAARLAQSFATGKRAPRGTVGSRPARPPTRRKTLK